MAIGKLKYFQEVKIIIFYMHRNTVLKIIIYYRVMNSNFERYIRFIIGKRTKFLRSFFSSEMYDNDHTQHKCDIN